MYEIVMPNELYHHGIKGQKWGVRRFQDKNGHRTAAGEKRYSLSRSERKEAHKYDHKNSEEYKNGNASKRRAMDQRHNKNELIYGRKAANRIEYEISKGRKTRDAVGDAKKREFVKSVASTAAVFGTYAAVKAGIRYYDKQIISVRNNNIAAGIAGDAQGLNTVKGGFTSGFKQAKTGKRFAENYFKSSYYKKHDSRSRYGW